MGREVTKTPDTKLRSSTRRHVGQEHTLLYYATQSVVRALTYADQGPGPTLTVSPTQPKSFRLHGLSRFAHIEVDSPTLNTLNTKLARMR